MFQMSVFHIYQLFINCFTFYDLYPPVIKFLVFYFVPDACNLFCLYFFFLYLFIQIFNLSYILCFFELNFYMLFIRRKLSCGILIFVIYSLGILCLLYRILQFYLKFLFSFKKIIHCLMICLHNSHVFIFYLVHA